MSATAAAPSRPRVAGGSTTGTTPLLRTSLKHDGRMFAPWIAIATVLSASSVLVYPYVFPTEQDRAGLAATVGANPALSLIFGPARDLTTVDGFNAWRSLALGGFLAALGAIFVVTRATRAQEDSGQAELLASGVMGRSSRLLVGVAMGLICSLLVGLVAGLVTIACGGDPESSMLLGATFTATGWMFAGAAAVAAQVGSDARTANSIAVGTLGALFVLRGFAYAVEAPDWTLWVNPMSWMTQTQPATRNTWWPLLLAVALTAALIAAAFALQRGRDFGQGTIKPGPGPARGADRNTWRLALRLNRGPILTWSVAFLMLGVIFGYLTTSITDTLGANTAVQHALASGATSPDQLVSTFLVTILSMVGIFASISGVQIMVKVRSEEMADRVEPLMATAVPRSRYYASNTLLALGTATMCLLIAGSVVALLADRADIGISFGDAALQALATVPAVWTVVAVAVAVIGARPVLAIAAWVGVVASFALTLLGPTFGLDDWVLGISPFWHVPNVALVDPDWSGLLWITLATGLLVAVGFAGFRRRDLAR